MKSFKLSTLNSPDYIYLKNSKLFESFNFSSSSDSSEEEEEEEEKEEKVLYGIICSENTEDINLFLNVAKFWGIYTYPINFFDLLHKIRPIEYLEELYIEINDPFYEFLKISLTINKIYLCNYICKCKLDEYLNYLIWANLNNYKWDKFTFQFAAENGYLNSLKYLHENIKPDSICPWDENTVYLAVQNNHLQVLTYALDNNCKWSDEVYLFGAINGNIEAVNLCVKKRDINDKNKKYKTNKEDEKNKMFIYGKNKIPIYDTIDPYKIAIKYDQVNYLKYIYESSVFPFKIYSFNYGYEYEAYLHIFYLFNECSLYSRLECLKYLSSLIKDFTNLEWGVHFIKLPSDINILKFINENKFPVGQIPCDIAAKNGNLEILKYLHENGYFWDKKTCNMAAENNNLECLIYLHENGCPWNKKTCYIAAENNNLECLIYLHENGCPWDDYILYKAIEKQNFDILKYSYENGATLDYEYWQKDIDLYKVDTKCLDYIKTNGIPINFNFLFKFY